MKTKCEHPFDKWIHYFDPEGKLGDYYDCGLCEEFMQIG